MPPRLLGPQRRPARDSPASCRSRCRPRPARTLGASFAPCAGRRRARRRRHRRAGPARASAPAPVSCVEPLDRRLLGDQRRCAAAGAAPPPPIRAAWRTASARRARARSCAAINAGAHGQRSRCERVRDVPRALALGPVRRPTAPSSASARRSNVAAAASSSGGGSSPSARASPAGVGTAKRAGWTKANSSSRSSPDSLGIAQPLPDQRRVEQHQRRSAASAIASPRCNVRVAPPRSASQMPPWVAWRARGGRGRLTHPL